VIRFYCGLLRLYPARFREEYAVQIERQLRDEYRALHSPRARALFWLRALVDLAVSIPTELTREIGQDLTYGARVYRRRKFVTGLALSALALAIGASTGVFSVINARLLRSLPFKEPGRLVQLWLSEVSTFSGRDQFNEFRRSSAYLSDAAGFLTGEMALARSDGALRLRVTETTANFFELFGVEPGLGRAFAPDEDVPGGNTVAVIGYGLWQQAFGGDSRILGSVVRVNGTVLTVIGIAPPGFDFPSKTALWAPTAYDFQRLPKSEGFVTEVAGRLKPGITLEQARAIHDAEVQRNHARMPNVRFMNRPEVRSLRDQLAGPVRQASLVLLAAVGFVLLIACANVAQLLLSRVSERREELAVRAGLGASRARLTQQLITEAVLLTTAAAVAGLLVTRWTSRLAAAAQPAPLESQSYAVLDWPVVVFALTLAALTGLAFGVLPAVVLGRLHPAQDVLRVPAGPSHGGASRMRFALIAMQAALTVVLMGGAVTMIRSFQALMQRSVWYHADGLATATVSLAGSRYAQHKIQREYYDEALRRLRSLPGVQRVAAVNFVPAYQGLVSGALFRTEAGVEAPLTTFNAATPDYFRTMGVTLISGRVPGVLEPHAPEREVVVTEGVAGRAILGQVLVNTLTRQRMRVVGVAPGRDPAMYLAWTGPAFATFLVRVRGEAKDSLPAVHDAIRGIDGEIPVYDVKTMEHRVQDGFVQERFYTTASTFLAGFALLLAAIGIFGGASYAVAQRTREIGVRIAVGAPQTRVRAMLARQSLVPLALGLVAGVGAAVLLGGSLQSLFRPIEPVGLAASTAAAGLFVLIGGAAVWRATARVTRIDPVQALRAE
jgi:putative ABC transport system permease protein